MTEELMKETSVKDLSDMMDVNCQTMSEIVNDRKMTPMERMKGITMGVRNQAVLSRVELNRFAVFAKLGMKSNGKLKALSFEPTEE